MAMAIAPGRRSRAGTPTRAGALALFASIILATPLGAQVVPPSSVGLDIGSGPRTQRAGETYYIGSNAGTLRLTGQARLTNWGRVAPVAYLETVYGGEGDQVEICGSAPNGSCRVYAPENGGAGVGIGLAIAPARFVDASVIAGHGRYGGTRRSFLATRLALSPLRHFAITASLTHMTWKERNGYAHWFRPVHLGVRIQ